VPSEVAAERAKKRRGAELLPTVTEAQRPRAGAAAAWEQVAGAGAGGKAAARATRAAETVAKGQLAVAEEQGCPGAQLAGPAAVEAGLPAGGAKEEAEWAAEEVAKRVATLAAVFGGEPKEEAERAAEAVAKRVAALAAVFGEAAREAPLVAVEGK